MPFVTWALIVANVAVFLATLPLQADPAAVAHLWRSWALIPAEGRAPTWVTSLFLHGGLMHLAGNTLFLWIFGDNLEDDMGHVGFALFYLACGVLANAAHVLSAPGSPVPLVGASGAIAGVMGGYLLLYPRARVDVLLVFVVFFRILPVPAWAMLGLWFLLQFVNGLGADPLDGGVAYWAHAGGFAAGLVLTVPVWLRRGGPVYWRRTQGHPPHPDARYVRSSVPVVRRRRR